MSQQSIVDFHGRMRTVPGKSYFIGEKSQQIVCPAGTSLFWSSASSRYYCAETVRALKQQFNAQVVRAAMTAWSSWSDGYTTQPAKYKAHAVAVADAAIAEGMYVILDWHCEGDNSGQVAAAKAFFAEMAQKYAGVPNVIYEIWNEPTAQTWADKIRPYCVEVIAEIRKYDPLNLILCGTQTWSQKVEDAAKAPIADVNVAYVLHFYSNLHGPGLYKNKHTLGVPVFVSEWGTPGEHANTAGFVEWLAAQNVPHVSWAANNKAEPLSYFQPQCRAVGPWDLAQDLTATGAIFLRLLKEWKGNRIAAPQPAPQPAPGGWAARVEAEAFRASAPGVQVVPTDDVGGGRHVAPLRKGAWMVYEMTLPVAGTYVAQYRVRAPRGGRLRMDYDAGKTVVGTLNLAAQPQWTTVEQTVTFPRGGALRVGLFAIEGGWEVNWFILRATTPS